MAMGGGGLNRGILNYLFGFRLVQYEKLTCIGRDSGLRLRRRPLSLPMHVNFSYWTLRHPISSYYDGASTVRELVRGDVPIQVAT